MPFSGIWTRLWQACLHGHPEQIRWSRGFCELKQFPSTCAGRKGFPIHSILSRTNGDKDLIKASIDTLSSVACLHLVHLKFFFFFFVYVSSGSPYLLHPSLSLCFPTVIDSSLQSLTAAHQHLLRSGETERVACAWKSVCCVMQAYWWIEKDCLEWFRGEVWHLNCYFLIHIYCCRDLVCCCFMVCGLGEHLIMQLTWVPWFVAMVIAKGARVL